MHFFPINLFNIFIKAIVPDCTCAGGGWSCRPDQQFGCDTDICTCDGCNNSGEACQSNDNCIYADGSGDLCITIDNCYCWDAILNDDTSDLRRCSSCDAGPPLDTCTTNDTCTSSFTSPVNFDWVSCGSPDWTCNCSFRQDGGGAPGYGPDF